MREKFRFKYHQHDTSLTIALCCNLWYNHYPTLNGKFQLAMSMFLYWLPRCDYLLGEYKVPLANVTSLILL